MNFPPNNDILRRYIQYGLFFITCFVIMVDYELTTDKRHFWRLTWQAGILVIGMFIVIEGMRSILHTILTNYYRIKDEEEKPEYEI